MKQAHTDYKPSMDRLQRSIEQLKWDISLQDKRIKELEYLLDLKDQELRRAELEAEMAQKNVVRLYSSFGRVAGTK